MTLKKVLGMATMAALAGLAAACSSSTNATNDNDSGAVVHDAGRLPDAAGSGEAGTCAPADESTFAPKWVPPRAARKACTTAQLDSFFLCQTQSQTAPAGTTPASCAPWTGTPTGTNLTCSQCIGSQDTEATWGPLIVHKATNTINTNFAGCFAIVEGKVDGSGCGGQIQASSECAQAACSANCPVAADGTGIDELNQCLGDAGQGTCTKYDTSANDCFVADSGSTAACLGPDANDFWGNARIVAGVFCGGANDGDSGAPDTGADTGAGGDANADAHD